MIGCLSISKMLSTAVAVPTMPLVMPMKPNVSSFLSTVSIATVDRKWMQPKFGGHALLTPKLLVSKSVSFERSRFTTYGYNTPKEKNHLLMCSAAWGSRCAAGQTQTVTRKSPTVTNAPHKDKLKPPELDHNDGTRKPPNNGGGGGGGGGGGKFSGGFFLFGLILFLSYWKDRESQGEYAKKKRQKLYQFWGRVYQ